MPLINMLIVSIVAVAVGCITYETGTGVFVFEQSLQPARKLNRYDTDPVF